MHQHGLVLTCSPEQDRNAITGFIKAEDQFDLEIPPVTSPELVAKDSHPSELTLWLTNLEDLLLSFCHFGQKSQVIIKPL